MIHDFDGVPLSLPEWVTEFRPHQLQAVREILDHFDHRKVVMVDAPTGAGKTLIGEMVRQVLMYRKLANKGIYVCSSKTLQEQILHDFPYARVIKGRSNYPTLDNPKAFEYHGDRHLSAANCTKFFQQFENWPVCDRCEDYPPDKRFREEEDTDFLHCHSCFPAGTLIETDRGLEPIESIDVGFRVRTTEGNWREVTNTQRRHNGSYLVEIKSAGALDFKATPDHPVFASSGVDGQPEWIKCGELEPDMYIWSKIPQSTGEFFVGHDLLRVFGWYLAEGSVSGGRTVTFSLNIKETEYATEIRASLSALGYDSLETEYPDRNVRVVQCHSSLLAGQLVLMGGSGAANKHIPHWLLYRSGDVTEILRSAWLGDGETLTSASTHSQYDTASTQLAHQLQVLALRAGVIPSWRTRPARKGHGESYRLSVSGRQLQGLADILGVPCRQVNAPRQDPGVLRDGWVGYRVEQVSKIRGRTTVYNFSVSGDESYVLAGQVGVHNCHPWQSCPYEVAKDMALDAKLTVANTAYFLTEANYVGRFGAQDSTVNPWHSRFLIMDEADTIESIILNYVELSIPKRALKELDLGVPRKVTVPESWLEWCDAADKRIGEHVTQLANKVAGYHNEPPPTKLQDELDRWGKHLHQVQKVAANIRQEPEGWVLDGYNEGNVSFRPIEVHGFARDLLWRHSERFLLMSATLVSPRQMAADLGLQDHEWESVEVMSSFSPERRLINVRGTAKMAYKTKDTEWPKLAEGIADILDHYPTDRILVHTVSYELTEFLMDKLKLRFSERLFTYSNAKEREKVLETYRNTLGAVLLAPSLERGVDLKDDSCRVVVVTKVPFPSLGDKRISQRLYGTRTGESWYAMQTVRSLVQMTGRAMRHEGDFMTAYVLDSQFIHIVWKNALSRNMIPRWWAEALVWEAPKRSA